jgi:hypothetical protein
MQIGFSNTNEFVVHFNKDEKHNYKVVDVFWLTPTIVHGF